MAGTSRPTHCVCRDDSTSSARSLIRPRSYPGAPPRAKANALGGLAGGDPRLTLRLVVSKRSQRLWMDDAVAIFVDGMGAAAATSGILSQLEGRIFALLYLHEEPLALEEIASALGQSKSNISVNIRGLVEWHLVRRVRVPGSRKDHYEAASNLWRVMQEVMERRFRWNVRQVIATATETRRALGGRKGERAFLGSRLDTLLTFFSVLDAAISAINQGQPFSPATLQNVPPMPAARAARRSQA